MKVLDLDKPEDLELFIFSMSNICILYAKPRTGKTSFMAAVANACTFHRPFLIQQHNEIRKLNAGGFNMPLTDTVCVANYYMEFQKFGYSRRYAYYLNPYKFGYSNKEREMGFVLPYSIIFITEGQKYFDSHVSLAFKSYQSRATEQLGHNDLRIFIDVQRPGLINANVRENACFLEVLKLEKKYKHNKLVECIWHLKFIKDFKVLERYQNTGDEAQTVNFKVSYKHNVFEMYNSKVYKPKWYDGHYNNEGLLYKTINYEDSVIGYMEYNQRLDDEIPDKKGEENKC